MSAAAAEPPQDPTPDVLHGMPGIVISVHLWDEGRTRQVTGLDPDVEHDTGHFVASVRMVVDTLVQIWSDVTALETTPLHSWTVRAGRYWMVGAGAWAWVLDPAVTDMGAVMAKLEDLCSGRSSCVGST